MAGERPPTSGLAESLTELRRQARLTQAELARRSGLSIRAVRDIEQGRVARPRSSSLNRLADGLGLTDSERDRLLLLAGDTTAAGPRVDILGALAVQVGLSPVPISSPVHHAVLGLLALRSPQFVSLDEIVDVVWGDDPPRTCRTMVQTAVSRLRTLLEADRPARGSDILRLSLRGYQLNLDPEAIDARRFESQASQARRADPPAPHLFEEALRLWRGAVLADAHDRLRQHPAALALARYRLDLVLAYADACAASAAETATTATAVKTTSGAISWLTTLAAEESLHEAVHARLILALARSGDRALAARVYTALRVRLSEELGVEPGDDVQSAYRYVLTEPPTTEVAASATTSAATTTSVTESIVESVGGPTAVIRPAQLPPDVAAFVGRADLLGQLDDLRTAARVVAITGTAGVGKTSLAVHWAHQMADQFPDGQLYANLRGFSPTSSSMGPAEALRGFLDALNVPPARVPADLPAQIGLYRSLLAGRRVLVVLDNAGDAEQVRSLLPGAPDCFVVVTSRNQLAGLVATDGACPLPVRLLSSAEARSLLASRLGEARLAAEPGAVDAIIARCSRLPLALSVVAARGATQPDLSLSTLVKDMGDSGAGLDMFEGDDTATDVRAVFAASYRVLTPAAARLFRLLGLVHGPDIGEAATASLAGVAPAVARRTLAELARAHLVAPTAPGRYTPHDLLRAYAAELVESLDDADTRHAAVHRILDHLLRAGHAAAVLPYPLRESITLPPPTDGVTVAPFAGLDDALAWFTAEHDGLLAAVAQAAAAGFDTHAWQLAWTLGSFCHPQRHWPDLAASHDIALTAAQRLGEPAAQAYAHRVLGHSLSAQGRFAPAYRHLDEALRLYQNLTDHSGQAQTHYTLMQAYERSGPVEQALVHAQRAHELYRADGNQTGQARTLNAVGWLHSHLGDHRQALATCRTALTLLEELDDRPGQAATWDSLGFAHQQLGEYVEAAACYRRAAADFHDLNDRHNEASCLTRAGQASQSDGDTDAVRTAWRAALSILDELAHPDATALRAALATIQ